MDIQSRKIEFIQKFLQIQSEDILLKLESILKKESISDYNQEEIKPMTMKEFDERIEKSMKDSKDDNVVSAEDLLKKIDKWK